MPDRLTKNQRHRAMASNRGRTGPERALALALWHRGLRYLTAEGFATRFGYRLAGNPDLIFSRKRVLVFVDGCFWHGCLACARVPDEYDPAWKAKIARTVERDRRVTEKLRAEGWTVLRVPEHAIRTKALLVDTADALARELPLLASR